jgi:hypothetical protein
MEQLHGGCKGDRAAAYAKWAATILESTILPKVTPPLLLTMPVAISWILPS